MNRPLLPKPAGDAALHALPQPLLDRITQGAAARDLTRDLPFDEVAALKAQGFGAIRLRGAALAQVLAQIHVLAAADSNLAHIWRNHFMLNERLIQHDPQSPILRRLRDEVAGGALIGLAGTEATRTQVGGGAKGSPLVPDRDGYRFTARKIYSTGSIFADWIVTYGELPDGTRVNIVLPRNREGITLVDDWDGMGQRLTGTGTTIFDHVQIKAEEVIRPESLHPQVSFLSSTIAQIVLTTVIAGIITAIARDAALVLGARESSFYFSPSASVRQDPLLLAALGERSAEAFAAEAIVLATGSHLDRAAETVAAGGDALAEVEAAAIAAAKAKITVDALAQRACAGLFDVAGASATRRGLNLDRHWRNLRTVASHNPASLKAMVVAAHELNGVPVPSQGFF